MNDFDVAKEDNEGRVQLDPSVWANPFKPVNPSNDAHAPFGGGGGGFHRNPDPAFLRQHFPNPFAPSASSSSSSSVQPSTAAGISHQLLNQHHHHQQMLQQQQQQQMFLQQQQLQMMEQLNKPMVNNIIFLIRENSK